MLWHKGTLRYIKGHFAKVCRSREKSFASEKKQQKAQKKGFPSPDKGGQARRHGGKKQNKSNDKSSDEDYVYTVTQVESKKTHATVKVNGQDVQFLVDTGARVYIIDFTTFGKLNKKVSLQKSSTKIIYAYGFQTPLPLKMPAIFLFISVCF